MGKSVPTGMVLLNKLMMFGHPSERRLAGIGSEIVSVEAPLSVILAPLTKRDNLLITRLGTCVFRASSVSGLAMDGVGMRTGRSARLFHVKRCAAHARAQLSK
jgi:hypothetical protein